MHLKKGLVVPATVADHVTPHRGDPEAFWYGQLQSLCKQCHDTRKTADDLRGYTLDLDPLGWPTDPRHPTNAPRPA
jgi:5-methylcytosine-specific restriction endonuclease McrA